MDDNLQFDKAEFDAPSAPVCGSCGKPMTDSYYQVGNRTVCANCGERFREYASTAGAGPQHVLLALLLGAGAAIAGGAIYGAVMAYNGSQWAIISIGVGIIVGKAVRKGSGGVGGVFYQCLAVALTYAAIAGAYAFAKFHEIPDPGSGDALAVAGMAYRLPFMYGASNAIGILIIAFGLWQAWRMNQGVALEVTGPHPIIPPKPIAGV